MRHLRSRRSSSFFTAAMAASLALWTAACGGDGGGGTEPDPMGNVQATVQLDGQGVADVAVGLFAPGGTTAQATRTTDGNGVARFDGLDPGSYDVEITPPEGLEVDGPARQTVNVTDGATANATFTLQAPPGDVVTIDVTAGLTFDSDDVTVTPGTTVRWVNQADIRHTVTPDGHEEWDEAELTTSGQVFEHTFESEGEFPYFCVPHQAQGMTGIVRVEAG